MFGIETGVHISGTTDHLWWRKHYKKTGQNTYASTAEWRLTTEDGALSDAGRDVADRRLGAFPALVRELQKAASESIKKIQDAKKLVTASAPDADKITFAIWRRPADPNDLGLASLLKK